MKVMSIVGTRPEIIKMSEIIKKLDKHTDHVFVHTGQNYDYELNEIFFDDLGLRKPDVFLNMEGDNLGAQIGDMLTKIQPVLEKEKPGAVVILGDTNSALTGIIAKRLKIPLFHLEAGNRCFDDNVPEEINRRILDHISDVNMVYTQNQRLYLRDEGIAKDRLFIMGSPMKEILVKHLEEIKKSTALKDYGVEPKKYIIASIHRDENIEMPENLDSLLEALNLIAFKYSVPVLVSTHPRLRKKLDKLDKEMHKNIQFLKPLGFFDYVFLQAKSMCVVSDSGTISEESSILGFPAVTIRNAIERPEAVDAGSILISGVKPKNILNAMDVVINNKLPIYTPADYNVDNCSERVLKVILGYTNYVKRYVWHES